MNINFKYLILPLSIMVCIIGNYSNAMERNNNEEMQKILAARNAYFAKYNNVNNSNNESNNENEINLNKQEQQNPQNSNTINNEEIRSVRDAYFANHNFNSYYNNINDNNIINTKSNKINEQEQKQLQYRVSELIDNMIDNDNFYNSLTVDEQNEFKEVFGLNTEKIPYIDAEKCRILEKFESKFLEHRGNSLWNKIEKNNQNISESNNNYNINALSKNNKDLKQRILNVSKFMNDKMEKDSYDEQSENNFDKILKLQEELEDNINYTVTQDDIEFLESMENYMSQTIINSRNTKQLLNNDKANSNNNSTDSINQDVKNDLNVNLNENLDENLYNNSEEYNYDDPDEVDQELLEKVRNAILFLRIKQKVLFNGDKTKSGYKELDQKITKFQELQKDMSNMSNDYMNDLNAIEKEMSTINRNNITLNQLYEAEYLLQYKVKHFGDSFWYNKASEFSALSPDTITKNDTQYYYLVNLLNENNQNQKNTLKNLREQAQKCADKDDYEMMEYYNQQANDLEQRIKDLAINII